MSQLSECHRVLDEHGIGRCSVPMWQMGCPSGFCDEPAYGVPPPSRTFRCSNGEMMREDYRYSGYVPALACPAHGGPQSRAYLDGNAYCAVFKDFTNLQESDAGFGDTPEEARAELAKVTGRVTC